MRQFDRRTALNIGGLTVGGLLAGCGSSSPNRLSLWDNVLGGDPDTPKEQWFITQAIGGFQKNDRPLTVNRASSSSIETWDTQFRAASIARRGPDVVAIFAGSQVQSYAPYLLPLQSRLSASARSTLTGWQSTRRDFADTGQILAVPFGAGSYFEVLYNKALFDHAGVHLPQPPRTWEEFLELAAALKKGGVQPITMGEQEGSAGAWIMSTLVGGLIGTQGFFDMRNGKRSLEDPAMIKGYENYKQLYDRKLVESDAPSVKNEEAMQRFLQGKGAMFIQGGWFNKQAVDGLGRKVDNFPIPTLAGSPHQGVIAGGPNEALAVTIYSKRKAAACRFLEYMVRPETLDLYVRLSQTESSNSKHADPRVITNRLLKQQARWIATRDSVYPFDNIMPQEVNDQLYRVNPAVLSGGMSPQAAVRTLAGTYDSLDLKKSED